MLLLATPLQAAETDDMQELRGVVRSKARLEIATDLTIPVAEAPLRDGMRFRKGELLLAFDCRRLEAEQRAASAAVRAATVEHNQKAHLRKHGAAGKGEVDLALAGLEKGRAELELAEAKMTGCRIEAPFDGRIVERFADVHEIPEPGKPLMVIVDDSNLEIDFVAPSRWLSWLEPGAGFGFTVDETGVSVRGRIERIGAEVDAVSQTVRLTGTLDSGAGVILPGMSGNALFDRQTGQ
ncbi:efflux RND transporter periplasmic adaptor subunit [Zhengella sp. ZM62]|uniref:efflux RND transporter periplasmic adaptor subunit n=1 Tax=Zhengella sedimenti TaxID=3390035 RepID=UPI00397564CE